MIGVYGANGFVGRHVVEALLTAGHPVRAVSRRFAPEIVERWAPRADLIEADFTNQLSMLHSLQGVDTVVQLVSSSSPGLGNRAMIEDIRENVVPHVAFLQDAIATGVGRYVFLSSGGTVYGPGAPVPTPETAPSNPINSHGLTKLMIEKYLQMFSHVNGLNAISLRVSNPYGPGQAFRKGQGLIPLILQRHREGRAIQIFGDGQSQRDYLYVSDLARAIEKVVTIPDLDSGCLNIGKGEGRTVLEVLAAVEAALGSPLEKEFVAGRNTDVQHSILDISRARALLSWTPGVAFEDGIRRMLERPE